jgi:hypothetical protein
MWRHNIIRLLQFLWLLLTFQRVRLQVRPEGAFVIKKLKRKPRRDNTEYYTLREARR